MKKSTLVAIVICLILPQISFSQTYNYPTCRDPVEKKVKITKVIRAENSTQIFFEYIADNDHENYILLHSPNTTGAYYISIGNRKYKLISTIGIANIDRTTHPQKGIPLQFSAIFEALPKSVTEFDLIEGSTGSWHFYGVELKNSYPLLETFQKANDNCDDVRIIPASPKPTFENMLTGVKHATILRTVKSNINAYNPVFNALSQYLTQMGFEVDIEIINEELDKLPKYKISSDNVVVLVFCDFTINPNNDTFDYSNFEWVFKPSINPNYTWSFYDKKATRVPIDKGVDGAQPYIYNVFRNMYQFKKPNYNPDYKIRLQKRQTCLTELKLKEYFQEKGIDEIEGIYESSNNSSENSKYRVGIKNINGMYKLIYLSGANNPESWDEGEIKATLKPTATQLFYKADWIMSNKEINSDFYISFEKGLFTVIDPDKQKNIYVKLYPIANENINSPNEITKSGSGFGISSNGYIITNQHVTNGATKIKVRGINGDFVNSYSAKVIIEDKNNDLSIIKIEDPKFTNLGSIPYVIASKSSDVGSSVFVLGYPLRSTMGEEVKLTNGIISSKSGYQGDVTSYQISVPIQPGNSGGPLFNNIGNIIGIVNAKLIGAENASYAIKSSYLLNLIDLLPTPLQLQIKSSLVGLSLPEQVKVLKKFTYIIEIN